MAKKSEKQQAINLGKPTTVIKQARLAIGFWNIRSVKQEAVQALCVNEMEKYSIDKLFVSKNRISTSGSTVITVPKTLHQFHIFYE